MASVQLTELHSLLTFSCTDRIVFGVGDSALVDAENTQAWLISNAGFLFVLVVSLQPGMGFQISQVTHNLRLNNPEEGNLPLWRCAAESV